MGKTAMIFAAGLGTRLKPLTDSIPKALVEVGGTPLLRLAIDRLADAGCTDIVINVHHFADMITAYLDLHPMGVNIEISDETDLLRDTGGGILHAEKYLAHATGGRFIVHNVDILSNLDLGKFISDCPGNNGHLADIVVSERDTSRYLVFDEEMNLAGWTDIRTGQIKTPYRGRNLHDEIALGKCRKLAFAGIHNISTGIFDAIRQVGETPGKYALYDGTGQLIEGSDKAFPEKFSIIDLYLRLCAAYRISAYVSQDFSMVDVGKTEQLARAQILKQKHVYE